MRIKYDLETDTLSITLKDEQVAESEYIEGKGIVIDYNENDEIVGYEIIRLVKISTRRKRINSKSGKLDLFK